MFSGWPRKGELYPFPSACSTRCSRRNHKCEVAHLGIVGTEERAIVAGDTGQNHRPYAQAAQEQIERRPVKSGMLRLEDEVVVARWLQQPRDVAPGHVVLDAVGHQRSKVRTPLAEVVVDINRRNARTLGARLSALIRRAIGRRAACRRRCGFGTRPGITRRERASRLESASRLAE